MSENDKIKFVSVNTVVKAASDVGPRNQLTKKPQQRRHVDYSVNTLHHKRTIEQEDAARAIISSATASDASEILELNEYRQTMKKQRNKRKYKYHSRSTQLKPEALNFRDYISYNVDFPNRASVQMFALMGSTKVRLNSPGYVHMLQWNIQKKEDVEVLKTEQLRVKGEHERLKKLVIGGKLSMRSLPSEMQHFSQHPAVRVNQVLQRLHDCDLVVVEKPNTKIIPVEPYEYSGDNYFRHLHATGEAGWVPSRVRRGRQKSQKTKSHFSSIHIDKLRTLFKRKIILAKHSSSDDDEEETNVSFKGDSIHTNVGASLVQKTFREFIQQQSEFDRKEIRDQKRERKHLHRLREKLYQEQRRSTQQWLKSMTTPRSSLASINSDEDPQPSPPNIMSNTSFDKLRKQYNLRLAVDSLQHRKPQDKIIMKYIDDAEDANELFGNSDALRRLYERETLFVNKFLSTQRALRKFDR